MTTELNWLKNLKVGDEVTRMLAGVLPMKLKITKIENGLIYCGNWTFDLETGMEEDECLHFGRKYGFTGSFLVEKHDPIS